MSFIDYFRNTNEDGRCPGLITSDSFAPGMYKIRFETGQYWESLEQSAFTHMLRYAGKNDCIYIVSKLDMTENVTELYFFFI